MDWQKMLDDIARYKNNPLERLRDRVAEMQDVSEHDKLRYSDALTFLAKELGNVFIQKGQRYRQVLEKQHMFRHHPLYDQAECTVPWQIKEFSDTVETMQRLKSVDSNYMLLIEKLRSINSAHVEGMPFLEVASIFLPADFDVKFLDVSRDKENVRSPDVELTNTSNSEVVYVEVTELNESDSRLKIRSNYLELQTHFREFPHRLFACIQKQPLSDESISEIKRSLTDADIRLATADRIISHTSDGIEYVMAQQSEHESFTRWCSDHGCNPFEVRGLPILIEEAERLIRTKKLIDKARQIPVDRAGLLWIPIPPSFFWPSNLSRDVALLDNHVRLLHNIIGIVFISSVVTGAGSQEVTPFPNGHFYSSKTKHDALRRDILFVNNPERRVHVLDDTLTRIHSALV